METTILPGYGAPVTHRRLDPEKLFPSALEIYSDAPLLTAREYDMMSIMNSISDKHHWDIKIFDDEITAKWKAEILAQPDADVSEKMFKECMAELKYKAGLFPNDKYVEALDGVFKSDLIIPEDLRLALIDAVRPLENVPEDQKDWHPRSEGKVLDLVHPSLYPLVYGQTRLLPVRSLASQDDWRTQYGLGDVSEIQEGAPELDAEAVKTFSTRFQWLPCDVDVSGNEVKIVSYINNLHPQKHHELYQVIEKIIQISIGPWEAALSRVDNLTTRPARIEMKGDGYGPATLPEPSGNPSNDDYDEWQEEINIYKDSRPIVQPEPRDFKPFETPDVGNYERVNLRADFDYPERRLQVIVKLATIHLTPSSPKYGGGTWHVEGAANECICASAIYYYQSDNISESLLSFRLRVDHDILDLDYEQDDHRAIETIFGLGNGDASIQDLGKIVTREGRLIVFPNAMQHRVEPFHLEDSTKPGYRKILALFLVDPHQRIISTTNVPPQQPEWWDEHLKLSETALEGLPQELKDAIKNNIPPSVSLDEAKRQREELMDERSVYVEERNREYINDGPGFSLCEH